MGEVPVNLEAAQLLDEAVALMNDEGQHWTKGTWSRHYGEEDASYCSAGALREAAFGDIAMPSGVTLDAPYGVALKALANVVDSEKIPTPVSLVDHEDRVIYWNDDPDRSWLSVTKAFKAAAAQLRRGK